MTLFVCNLKILFSNSFFRIAKVILFSVKWNWITVKNYYCYKLFANGFGNKCNSGGRAAAYGHLLLVKYITAPGSAFHPDYDVNGTP